MAAGTYKPSVQVGGTGSRYATFQMENGVTILGGYPDGGGVRNPSTYAAILSGDIGTVGDNSDNCYHVFYHPDGTNLSSTAVLDGFLVTAGNANGTAEDQFGGGMFNDSSSPTVTNCTFSGNSANDGGGMFNHSSSPTVTNCTFSGNSASYDGGGMFNGTYSSPTVTNCTFSGNSAGYWGGGMFNYYYSSPTVTNCTFSSNSASEGGGMFNGTFSSPTVTNCTFSGNSAGLRGGGMYNQLFSSPMVTNSIFWANSGGQLLDDGVSPTVTYCDVQGGYAGTGNIGADPLFVDADGADGVYGTLDDNLHLQPGSPCINTGNNAAPSLPAKDFEGDDRILDGTVDIGVDEAPAPVIVPMTAIVDNDDPGFSIVRGSWYYDVKDSQAYYQHDHRYQRGGAAVAQYEFADLIEGATYRISATWIAHPNRANNAPFKLLVNGVEQAEFRINQQAAPNDFTDAGTRWEELVTYTPTDADSDTTVTLQIQVLSDANGYVIADAVRVDRVVQQEIEVSANGSVFENAETTVDFERTFLSQLTTRTFTVTNRGVSPLTLTEPISVAGGFTLDGGFLDTTLGPGETTTLTIRMNNVVGQHSGEVSFGANDPDENPFAFTVRGTVVGQQIIDNGQPGYRRLSALTRVGAADAGYYRSTHEYHARVSGPLPNAGSWTFEGLQPGVYQVSATWLQYWNRATDALYTITSGSNTSTKPVNQRVAPSSYLVPGEDPVNPSQPVNWEYLDATFTVPDTAAALETLTVTLQAGRTGYVIADAVKIRLSTDLTAASSPSIANGGLSIPNSLLTAAALAPVVAEAQAFWAATGLSAAELAVLQQIQFVATDLGGRTLGRAEVGSRKIYLDNDAAGWGWFIDATPQRDEEFVLAAGGTAVAPATSAAAGKMDLLTAVMHEMGHLLGKADQSEAANDVMSGSLSTGIRRRPEAVSSAARDALFAAWSRLDAAD